MLPKIAFFDLRPDLEAGRSRLTAVSERIDHFIDLLKLIMGAEQFDQAVRAYPVLLQILQAVFDPEFGSDVPTFHDLQRLVHQLQVNGEAPTVSDSGLQEQIEATAETPDRVRERVLDGVQSRLGTVAREPRLRSFFAWAPEDPNDAIRFEHWIDEDALFIFDTSRLTSETAEAIEIVLLSELWAALKRRSASTESDEDPPLVTLWIEEATEVADTELVSELLAEGRGHGLATCVSLQLPNQLNDEVGESRIYKELINNTGTVITGRVHVDPDLASRFVDAERDAATIAARLRNLPRDRWLVDLAEEYGTESPRAFELISQDLPAGVPGSDRPLSDTEQAAFEKEFRRVQARTETQCGRRIDDITSLSHDDDDADETTHRATDHTQTTLPFTRRLPNCVEFDMDAFALVCTDCGRRTPPTSRGLRQAISCHHSIEDIDRDDIPVVNIQLTVSPTERAAADLSLAQFRFLQLVADVQLRRVDPLEYDIVDDSMRLLREYAGIDTDAVQDLLDRNLLVKDLTYPHLIYSVTQDGMAVLKEEERHRRDFGHGAGDLGEGATHVFLVEVGQRYLEQEYVADPGSPVVRVETYYEQAGRRFDIVGLDTNDDIVVVVEAERVVGSLRTDAPEDFDGIAAVNPEEAIWIVPGRQDGHKILEALNDPAEGPPRIEQTYAEGYPLHKRSFDADGLTRIDRVSRFHDRLDTT